MVTTPALMEKLFDTEKMVKPQYRTNQPLPPASQTTGTLFKMAWPAVLETVLVSLISLVDTVMVGTLGYQSIAAVGLTTQPRMIVLALFTSLNVGITALVARRKGAGERETANKVLRQALFISLIGAIVMSVLGVYFSRDVLLLMGAAEDTIGPATQYLRIMLGGIFFNIMSLAITAAQRGAGNTRISMRTNLCANLVNILFNWLLINGKLGFPKLGVAGAAIATVLGYVVAFIMAVYSVARPESFLHLNLKDSFLPQKSIMKPLMSVGASMATEQLFLRIGFFIFTRVAASLGTVAMATHQIGQNVMMVSFAFGEGLAIAASSLVGQSLGAKRPDLAIIYGHTAQRFGMIMAVCLITFDLCLGQRIIMPFSKDPEILTMGVQLIYVLVILTPAQITQYIFSNCLRVGGDNKYVAIVTSTCILLGRSLWSWILCYPLGLGLVGAWLGFVMDQYARLIILGLRYVKGGWTRKAL